MSLRLIKYYYSTLSKRKVLCGSFIIFSLYALVRYDWKLLGAMLLYISIHIYTFVSILDTMRVPPPNSPDHFTKDWYYKQSIRRPVLLCLGDSLTNGLVSANFTTVLPSVVTKELQLQNTSLQPQTPPNVPPNAPPSAFQDPLWVVNAGYNYAPTEVIVHEKTNLSLHVHPDYVLLLVGTNDILALYKQSWKKQIATYNAILESSITLTNFEQNIRSIIQIIQEASPKVEIGICTLPPLGEDLSSDANQLIQQGNEIIESIVADLVDEISIFVLPLYEELATAIQQKKVRNPLLFGKTISIDYYMFMFFTLSPIYYLLSKIGIANWNLLSNLVNHEVLIDGVHMNERGRDILIKLVVEWLKLRNLAKTIVVKSLR